MRSLASTLEHHARVRPDKVALVTSDRTLTYRGFQRRVHALATAFHSAGVRRGEVVAIVMLNRTQYIETIYAVNAIGAVFLPINSRLAVEEWRYILADSGSRAIVCEGKFAPQVRIASEDLDLTVALTVGATAEAVADFSDYEEFLSPHLGESFEYVDVDGSELQRLMYTSGTTSRPKGVCITHDNFAWKNMGMLVQFGWTEAEICLVGGPLFHVGALDMGGLTLLHAGGTIVIQERFEPGQFLKFVEQYKVTTCWLAPAMVNQVLHHEDLGTCDLRSLVQILSGGEKMPVARLEELLKAIPHVWFADAYGLTETVSSDTFVDKAHMKSKIGSVGLPIPHQEVRIVGSSGSEMDQGSIGEIVVRGPKVFAGYLNNMEATRDAFRDGWFHTGDMGWVDEDGYLFVADRKKDMIISGGENIASPEIERVLFMHPAVLEAAVVGHTDAKWGEVPHAFVVVKDGVDTTAEEILRICREHLAKFKVPKYVTFTEVLPRTTSGKVLKRVLRQHADGVGAKDGARA